MLFICLFLNVPVVLHPWKFWNVNNLWEASSALSLCSLPRNVTNNTSILFIRSGPCLILLSSLVFLTCAIPILLILNFFASCVFDWVVAWKTTSELKSLAKAAVFFHEPLWNSKSACCLCFFCASGEAVPELRSLPTDFCQSQSVWGTHYGRPGAPRHMASHFISEWFCERLHIDETFLWKLLLQWLSDACWVCQTALGFVWLLRIFLCIKSVSLKKVHYIIPSGPVGFCGIYLHFIFLFWEMIVFFKHYNVLIVLLCTYITSWKIFKLVGS